MNREEGHYHIKVNGKWVIAYWDSSLSWFSWFEKGHGTRSYGVGASGVFDDFQVESIEINETRIPSPDELKIIYMAQNPIAAWERFFIAKDGTMVKYCIENIDEYNK